jgi:hypothetical protein
MHGGVSGVGDEGDATAHPSGDGAAPLVRHAFRHPPTGHATVLTFDLASGTEPELWWQVALRHGPGAPADVARLGGITRHASRDRGLRDFAAREEALLAAGYERTATTGAALMAEEPTAVHGPTGGRWIIVTAEGKRLSGEMGTAEHHASEAACLAYKDDMAERARAVAQKQAGEPTSALAETWAAARCVPE